MKGGIFLEDTGYITVNAFTGQARIPLANVTIAVTASDGTAIALRLTDRSGRITPVEIPGPALSAGQSPDTGVTPFTSVNLYARLEGYEQLENAGLQVFPDTVTQLQLQMIPLPELPDAWDTVSVFPTPTQNL